MRGVDRKRDFSNVDQALLHSEFRIRGKSETRLSHDCCFNLKVDGGAADVDQAVVVVVLAADGLSVAGCHVSYGALNE
jgi:hypothetical protein